MKLGKHSCNNIMPSLMTQPKDQTSHPYTMPRDPSWHLKAPNTWGLWRSWRNSAHWPSRRSNITRRRSIASPCGMVGFWSTSSGSWRQMTIPLIAFHIRSSWSRMPPPSSFSTRYSGLTYIHKLALVVILINCIWDIFSAGEMAFCAEPPVCFVLILWFSFYPVACHNVGTNLNPADSPLICRVRFWSFPLFFCMKKWLQVNKSACILCSLQEVQDSSYGFVIQFVPHGTVCFINVKGNFYLWGFSCLIVNFHFVIEWWACSSLKFYSLSFMGKK